MVKLYCETRSFILVEHRSLQAEMGCMWKDSITALWVHRLLWETSGECKS